MPEPKKIRVGIDARSLVEARKDGIAYYTQNLVSELIKDDSVEFVLYFNKGAAEIKRANVALKSLRGPNIAWPQLRLSLNFLTSKPPIDLLLSPSHSVPLYCPVPSIPIIYDLAYFKFKKYFTWFDYIMLAKLTTNLAVKNSSHLITISQSTKKDIIKYFNVSPDKISVIYPSYNNNIYYPRQSGDVVKVKSKYNIQSDYIIYVGTLQKRKNIVRLIKAFAKLKKTDKISGQLVLVGKKGWLYEDIFTIVKELKLQKEVIFTGYVPLEELPALISGAKYYVLPSLYEGFGLPLLEAMACGTPVITSNVSSMPEVCQEAGLLINDPYDVTEIYQQMKTLYYDENLRAELSNQGLERCQAFSWEKCARETIAVIKKTINGPNI